ncbi:hypothetical protein PYCC9005_002840 [Savitreella phatthalungensis]
MWGSKKPSSSSETQSSDDKELASFLAEIGSDAPARTDATPVTPTAVPDTPLYAPASVTEPSAGPRKEEPCPLQYYFDEFFMCYTPKSQLVHYYRYGEKKDCAERWRDLRWCFETRLTDDDTAQKMLRDRRAAKLEQLRAGPNSERVWEFREEPLADPWGVEARRKAAENGSGSVKQPPVRYVN